MKFAYTVITAIIADTLGTGIWFPYLRESVISECKKCIDSKEELHAFAWKELKITEITYAFLYSSTTGESILYRALLFSSMST